MNKRIGFSTTIISVSGCIFILIPIYRFFLLFLKSEVDGQYFSSFSETLFYSFHHEVFFPLSLFIGILLMGFAFYFKDSDNTTVQDNSFGRKGIIMNKRQNRTLSFMFFIIGIIYTILPVYKYVEMYRNDYPSHVYYPHTLQEKYLVSVQEEYFFPVSLALGLISLVLGFYLKHKKKSGN